jgi:hypothetical protein
MAAFRKRDKKGIREGKISSGSMMRMRHSQVHNKVLNE